MNCVPGDLAFNVHAAIPERLGAIVEVLRPANVGGVDWVISWRGQEFWAFDRYLRPIRDNDGEDQTLTWAGKPQELERA